VASLWAIQAVVVDRLRAALMPGNVTVTDLLQAKHTLTRLLAEAKRQRQRQKITATKALS